MVVAARRRRPPNLERSLKRSLTTSIALLRRAAAALDPSGKVGAQLRQAEEEVARAMLPEDWIDVAERIEQLKIPAAVEGHGPGDESREVVERTLRRLAAMARTLMAPEIEQGFRELKPQVDEDPVPLWASTFDGEVQALVASVADLREARDILHEGLVDVAEQLSEAAGRSPQRMERLASLKDRLAGAGDVEELHTLRMQLMHEASAFGEEVRQTHEELDATKKRATAATSRARRLAKAYVEADDAARTDALTDLGNRRDLDGWVHSLSPQERPCAVLRVDIDGIDKLRTDSGHAAGDELLTNVANSVLAGLRYGDRAFRLSGDEMVVVIKGASKADAGVAARRLAQEIAKRRLQGPPTTISVGAGVWTKDGSFADALMAADAALLDAKRQGAGRVVVA
jgi:diguanylate cyclase (GGDEF)-like protein